MKIRIKKKNIGKFNATKKRTGKTTEELTHSKNPLTRKRAIFAQNAKKWNHKHAGPEGTSYLNNDPWTNILLSEGNIYTDPINNEIPITVFGNPDMTHPIWRQGVFTEGLPQPQPVDYITRAPYLPADQQPKETTLGSYNDNNIDFNPEYLRYAPAVGAGIAALQASLQPKDYSYANRLEQLAGRYNPVSAPAIGGYRAYTPYDVNLGDAENLAVQAAALRANRGQNRATQAALNTAILDKMSKANSERNLAAQQANEANRLAVDTYNRGIDERNAALTQAYDQLNQQINNNRINMLARAAAARDASDEAWANAYNLAVNNFWNQLGGVGLDNWNYNRLQELIKSRKESE